MGSPSLLPSNSCISIKETKVGVRTLPLVSCLVHFGQERRKNRSFAHTSFRSFFSSDCIESSLFSSILLCLLTQSAYDHASTPESFEYSYNNLFILVFPFPSLLPTASSSRLRAHRLLSSLGLSKDRLSPFEIRRFTSIEIRIGREDVE